MPTPTPTIESRRYPTRVLTDRHAFHQMLLGLEGCVEVETSADCVHVTRGVWMPIAAGTVHHFVAAGTHNCLVLDLPVAWCEALELDVLAEGAPRRLPEPLVRRAGALAPHRLPALADWLGLALEAGGAQPRVLRLRLIRLLPRVLADLAHPWRIREMAACCCMAEAVFARQFRALTGQTPHAWLLEQRLKQASGLMGDRRASLTDIALACGFGDSAHFSRAFRQAHSCSPRAWRRLHTGQRRDRAVPAGGSVDLA